MLLLFDNAGNGNIERVWHGEYVKHNLLRNARLEDVKVSLDHGVMHGMLYCGKDNVCTQVTIVDVTRQDYKCFKRSKKKFFNSIIDGWIKKYPSLKRLMPQDSGVTNSGEKTMIQNFFFVGADGTAGSIARETAKYIDKIKKLGSEAQVMYYNDEAFGSVVVCILPSGIKRKEIKGDVQDVFGYATKIHIDKKGKLWFKFKKEHGLHIKRWLSEENAITWINGIMAAQDVHCTSNSAEDTEQCKKDIAAAKALI